MFTLTIKDQNGQIADSFSFDQGSYTIGRLDSCDIVLPSNSVSREHARIFIEGDRCYVEDLESANGVIVDGQRVVKTRDLGTASQIRIGEYYLYLEYERPADSKNQDVMSTLFIDSGSDHHKLVRVNDAFAGEEFSLSEQENTIGRTDDNFILLSDTSISRRHAVIHRRGDIYTIEDRGSSNGTRLNGKEVTRPVDLSAGDHVEFGNVEFIFAESDASVDPNQSVQAGGGLSQYASTAAFMVMGLLVGAAAVGGFVIFMHIQDADDEIDPTEQLRQDVTELIEAGHDAAEGGEWEQAFDEFAHAAQSAEGEDLADLRDEAQQLRDEAEAELEGAEALSEGRRLSVEGRYQEAREQLLATEGTEAQQRAWNILEDIEADLRHSLTVDARRLLRENDPDELQSAHEKIESAHDIDPEHEDVIELIEEIEEQLDAEGIDYEPIGDL